LVYAGRADGSGICQCIGEEGVGGVERNPQQADIMKFKKRKKKDNWKEKSWTKFLGTRRRGLEGARKGLILL